MDHRLSFIIIGKNEGWKLSKCLASVYTATKLNNIIDFEVVYVDSNSSDDSIDRAKTFDPIHIIKLTGDCNAAIGRNVGAQLSSGDVFLFLDGDMELIAEALPKFYSPDQGLPHPFISGNLLYHYYSPDWQRLYTSSRPRYKIQEDIMSSTVGGLFLIERRLWELVGGMKGYLRMGEDGDFALRLAQKGYLLLRRSELLVHHHMISYLDNQRKWRLLAAGAPLYSKTCLYRNNWYNPYAWRRMLRHDYSMLILFFSFLVSFIFASAWPLLLFLGILLLKAFRRKNKLFSDYIYYLVRDLQVLLGFVLFFPHKRKNIKFEKIH